jgi:hypothetical protein
LLLIGFAVELELTVYGVADAPFQAPERFSSAFAFVEFASVVATAWCVVADLGNGRDVDCVVELPVPGPAQPMPVVVA